MRSPRPQNRIKVDTDFAFLMVLFGLLLAALFLVLP